jgi:HAD superfamily hydrolase (TIGR01484 family)
VLPLSEFAQDAARRISVVLTDIDDTLTHNGRLPALAYDGMERLHEAGLIVVPVTGRPAGWCDLIARQWPVDAVVGENGAFWFRYDDAARRMSRRFLRPEAARARDRERLGRIAEEILLAVPGAAFSADQGYRAVDLAIDFCEDVPALPDRDVRRIVDIFNRHGAAAKVSSIHVNGWFGNHDKLTCSLKLLNEEFGIKPGESDRIVFVGDSPNDSPMFSHFPNSVGVANVLRFHDRMASLPAYVTAAASANGFRELVERLLAARREPTQPARLARPSGR